MSLKEDVNVVLVMVPLHQSDVVVGCNIGKDLLGSRRDPIIQDRSAVFDDQDQMIV